MAEASPRSPVSLLASRAEWLRRYRFTLRLSEQGTVVSVGDGIVWIEGLPSAAMEAVVRLEDGSHALVFHLAKRMIGGVSLAPAAQSACRGGPDRSRHRSIGQPA